MSQRADGVSDEDRAEAQEMARELARIERAARELPPLHGLLEGEPYGKCATCGDVAPAYKLIEGVRFYICGKCIVRESEEWEKGSS